METAVSYPGVKNCTAQRVMYIERPRVAEKRAYLALKRAFDISGALVGLAVLALPMSVIALIIALDSPGDPIFKQERLGKDGKPFIMYKFRSMCEDAERDGPRWADTDDARCTRFGAFLRRTRLDELPQIWNILRGDMSFVGPRPERACFYRKFEQYIIGFSNRLAVTPGIDRLCAGQRRLRPQAGGKDRVRHGVHRTQVGLDGSALYSENDPRGFLRRRRAMKKIHLEDDPLYE